MHKSQIMNKIAIIIVALLLCGVAEAQTKTNKSSLANKRYFKTGYRGFIETGVAVSDNFKTKEKYLCLSDITIQGYQMSDHMFVGLGIGRLLCVSKKNEEYTSFPILPNIRYEFQNRVISPFVDMQCGGTLGDFKGLHLAFSFGFRSFGRYGGLLGHFSYSLGYSLQTYKSDYNGLTSGQDNKIQALNSFTTFKMAIDWGARLKRRG